MTDILELWPLAIVLVPLAVAIVVSIVSSGPPPVGEHPHPHRDSPR